MQLVIAQGAVLYEVDLNFDPDDDYPKEDDRVQYVAAVASKRGDFLDILLPNVGLPITPRATSIAASASEVTPKGTTVIVIIVSIIVIIAVVTAGVIVTEAGVI